MDPFCFLVFLAALQAIPDELIEQARLDTNSEWDLWREVILPMLQPIIILVILLRLAEAFKLFDIVATLTKVGPGSPRSPTAISPSPVASSSTISAMPRRWPICS